MTALRHNRLFLRLLVQRYEIYPEEAIVFPSLDFTFPVSCENGGIRKREVGARTK